MWLVAKYWRKRFITRGCLPAYGVAVHGFYPTKRSSSGQVLQLRNPAAGHSLLLGIRFAYITASQAQLPAIAINGVAPTTVSVPNIHFHLTFYLNILFDNGNQRRGNSYRLTASYYQSSAWNLLD
jgi:hypothetical protein